MRAALGMMAGVWVLANGAVAGAAPLEGDGFGVKAGAAPWSRWQARVAVGTRSPALRDAVGARDGGGLKLRALSVMGDYYFSPSLALRPSGFRATSGLLVGSRPALSPNVNGADYGLQSRGSPLDGRTAGAVATGWSAASPDMPSELAAIPYVGIGYSGASDKGGFSFSADLGLMALSPRSAVKLGRGTGGAQSLDETLRDLRLSPVLQFGVSYSF